MGSLAKTLDLKTIDGIALAVSEAALGPDLAEYPRVVSDLDVAGVVLGRAAEAVHHAATGGPQR